MRKRYALMKTLTLLSSKIGLLALLLVGAGELFAQPPTGRATTGPATQEARAEVIASGEVRPLRYVKLTSEINGRIQEIYVQPGEQIKKGQPLLRIDPSEETQSAIAQATNSEAKNARNAVTAAEQDLTPAEAAAAQAKQKVLTAESEFNTAERELKRATDLVEANIMSRAEYDAARDRYDEAKAKLQKQRIALKEASESADQKRGIVTEARTRLRSAELRADQRKVVLREKATQYSPLDGLVADLPVRVGEIAPAGSSKALMTIADMSTIRVDVIVDEPEISRVKVGQTAVILVDALGETKLYGVVTHKNPQPIFPSLRDGHADRANAREEKEFRVTIELRRMPDRIRSRLRPGMSATATFATRTGNSNRKPASKKMP